MKVRPCPLVDDLQATNRYSSATSQVLKASLDAEKRELDTKGTSLLTGGDPSKIRGNYARFLTIFWNMMQIPQVSQPFWAQRPKKKHRTRALSCHFQPHHSASTETHTETHRHTHTEAETHTHTRSTAQRTCSVAILSSKRRERNSRTRALSWQSLLQDSPHTGTHTHASKNTHRHTHIHTYTHTHGHRDARHTHTHCDDPIPMRRSSFFFLQFLERPTSPTQWAFQETVQSPHLGRWGPS